MWDDRFTSPNDIPYYRDPYMDQGQQQPDPGAQAPMESLGASPYGGAPTPAPQSVSAGPAAPQAGQGFWGGVRGFAGGYGRGMWDSLRGGMQNGMYQRPGAGGMGYRMGYGGMRRPVVSRGTPAGGGAVAPVAPVPEVGGQLGGTITRTAPSQGERAGTEATTLRRF